MIAPPKTIETPRLLLRRPTIADAAPIFDEYAQDPQVTRFLSWKPHKSVQTLEGFLREALSAEEKGSRWLWVIMVKGSDRPLGMIDAKLQDHRFNFGYVLARRCWGQGYMPEALRPLVDWAFEQDQIYRVWAFCDVDNRASARVLEKLGMQREGIVRRWFVHPNISEVARDCYFY